MPVRFLALIVSLFALDRAGFRRRTQSRHQRPLPADRLSGGHRAARHDVDVNLKLRNYALAPERLALSVAGVPQGWTATLLGGGQPIAAAMPATDDSVSLDLRLDVPKDAKIGTQTLTVNADGGTITLRCRSRSRSPRNCRPSSRFHPQLPELRGSSRSSFEYTLTIKNDSGKKLLVSLAADAPQNFDTSFTEAYGTQQLTAIPVDAGKTKDVKLKVSPPDTVDAGHYPVTVHIAAEDARATAEVALDITGEPKLTLAGREGLLSARATAGKESSVPVDGDQYRHRAGREYPTVGQRAERLENRLRAEDHRSHRAQRAQGGAGADQPAGQGDRRRLCHCADRLHPRRDRHGQFPRHRHDLDGVGHRRHRHHRRRAADHGRRRRAVRPPMSDIVIEAKGLTKRYGAAYAVDGVTFDVAAGEIFGLLGPNGAGKTTTILMLLGLSDISAGQARVFGHDPMREPLAVKRLVGYLPDSVGFYDNLTAAENLHYTARLMGLDAD